MAKKSSQDQEAKECCSKERYDALLHLTGHALQAFIARESPQRLPHEILVENLAREAVRFASRTLDELDKQVAQG